MTQPATDGLLALQNKRAAARRGATSRIKPSQNPNTLPPYEPQTFTHVSEPTVETTKAQAPKAPAGEGSVPESGQGTAAGNGTEGNAAPAARVKGTTAYLDEPHKAYLRKVAIEGLTRTDKIDVSSSAVIRFALDRVIQQMTPEQVYEAIAAKPIDPKATGRKRR